MSTPNDSILQSILDARQIPHQPLLLIQDTPYFSGLPLLSDLVQRSISVSARTTLVTCLRSPSLFINSSTLQDPYLELQDLSTAVAGYTATSSAQSLVDGVIASLKPDESARHVIIEGLEVFAEDWDEVQPSSGTKAAMKLLRSTLAFVRQLGAPSRLTVLMLYRPNSSSALADILISPEFSSTLTHLHLHPKNLLLTHFPSQYLLPPTSSPGTDLTIATLLRSARERGLGDQLALQGADGIEVLEAWGSKHGKGAAVEVLVRKAQGGASKGMARSIELVEPVKSDDYTITSTLLVRPLPALQSKQSQPTGTGQSQDKTPHLDLPFNLSLTDAQRQARADVPLPYAHEGDEDGASKVAGAGIWWEADEGDGLDDEEEEI